MSTYINVLMVHAFDNWHEVSWGTKGSDKGDSLPSANVIKGTSDVMVEEAEQEQEDIDSCIEKVVHRALASIAKTGDDKPARKDIDDSYRSFRTGLVYSWLLSNLALRIVVTSDDFATVDVGEAFQTRKPVYFPILLYATAILSID
ncbi:hypothetical protein G6011_10855 [Alternaria panax]|uniref:Uncharacterized protein n=1 Tax=Alternaria panax TaxID=48097 RepID=A0AAD4ICU6_9PLEO|nr:hypothetical protein G6011_10855 [Alternaria panax]